MVSVGADPNYLEKPDGWGTAFVYGIAHTALPLPAAGTSSGRANVSSSTSSSSSTDTGAAPGC